MRLGGGVVGEGVAGGGSAGVAGQVGGGAGAVASGAGGGLGDGVAEGGWECGGGGVVEREIEGLGGEGGWSWGGGGRWIRPKMGLASGVGGEGGEVGEEGRWRRWAWRWVGRRSGRFWSTTFCASDVCRWRQVLPMVERGVVGRIGVVRAPTTQAVPDGAGVTKDWVPGARRVEARTALPSSGSRRRVW